MAKRVIADRRPTRRQLARREREQRAQRLIMGIAIAVGAVILGLLIYGIVTEVFIEARRPVAQVNDTTITAEKFKARQGYERWMTQLEVFQYQMYLQELSAEQALAPEGDDDGLSDFIQQLQFQLSNLEQQLSPDMATLYASQVLDAMVEEELVRQEAQVRGLSVTDAEVESRIGLMLGYNPEATTDAEDPTAPITETIAPLPEPEDFDELYSHFKSNVLEVTRFSERDFRAMVRADLLRDRLRAEFAQDIPEVQDQVEATIFIVETEEAAETVSARINDEGADPQIIADEFVVDENPNTSGFDIPWLPAGFIAPQLGEEVERAAFNTPVGRASEPVMSWDDQFVVVYVKGREERPLDELLGSLEEQAYQGWLAQAKETRTEYFAWERAVVVN